MTQKQLRRWAGAAGTVPCAYTTFGKPRGKSSRSTKRCSPRGESRVRRLPAAGLREPRRAQLCRAPFGHVRTDRRLPGNRREGSRFEASPIGSCAIGSEEGGVPWRQYRRFARHSDPQGTAREANCAADQAEVGQPHERRVCQLGFVDTVSVAGTGCGDPRSPVRTDRVRGGRQLRRRATLFSGRAWPT